MTDYAEAHAQSRRALAQARLSDPKEHFPFKAAEAKAALRNKKMGPDQDTASDVTGADFTSQRIIDATEAYVAAEQAMLEDETPGTRSALEAAADDLVAARRTHRRARLDASGNPVGGVVGTTDAVRPAHMRGVRQRRVGEE